MNDLPFHPALQALRATALTLVALSALAFPALAGDYAERVILGFSDDGSRFAFEEYGQEDGSGYTYSNIYIIDTATDQWTDGSPYRARIEEDAPDVEVARQQARAQAAGALAGIVHPGTVNATNTVLELPADSKRMAARPFWFSPRDGSVGLEFRLVTRHFSGEEWCVEFGGPVGFTLLQISNTPGEATRKIHEDTSIPSSRGCPLDYHLADIVTFYPGDDQDLVVAVLILMEKRGFEGPDGRYLAVTTHAAQQR
ncbi:MAG: DUF2259 domain-containing protein [Nitratireductor sp.]|nr:DUF2259 domain-containing protein [Nitratireductor sp.]